MQKYPRDTSVHTDTYYKHNAADSMVRTNEENNFKECWEKKIKN